MTTPHKHDEHQDQARVGEVIPFPTTDPAPAHGSGVEPGPEVLAGELVSEEEYRRRFRPAVAVVAQLRESERAAHVRSVVAYRVRMAPRDVCRLCWFAARGHARWVRKAWTWATYGDLRADVRAARAARDVQARREAQALLRAEAAARAERVRELARRIVVLGSVAGAVALTLAVVDDQVPRDEMWGWLAAVYDALDAVWALLGWVLVLAPAGVLVAAAWEGRDKTPGAGWLVRPTREDPDSWVDERMISQALAHLGIAPLDKFLKQGGELVYTIPARVDGDGTYAQVRLPMGVTADMIAAKRTTLAANLGRAVLETWPTQGDEAGILDLWVADKGKLGGGAGPWPLLHDGDADVFAGVPIGRSQRGQVIEPPLFETNWLIGGRPGQGKSAAMRTLLLGAALDPTAELWVTVMGQSPDFDPFRPRLSRYGMGMDDEVAAQALANLRDLLTEMERRGKTLASQPGSPPKTSRKLAGNPRLGLHPLIYAIDECHELFTHPTYGREATDLAVRLIKRGRKYGIILLLATQSPTKDSIPRDVTRNVSAGVAFAVGDHVANDGLLGAGKYAAGVRATDLRMHTDRGTSVAVGVSDNPFELVRWFYVPFEDGIDAVTPVIARAMSQLGELRRTGTTTPRQDEAPTVDHLADVAAVLGADRKARTQTVLARLAEHNPTAYEGWTFSDLRAALAEHDVEPVKSDGVMVVRAADITTALTHRNHTREGGGDAEAGS